MMKRIIGSVLIMVAIMSMVVSCKDYDDDINDLRNQLSSSDASLTTLVNEKVATVESEISSLTSQLTAMESAYTAADVALQNSIDAAIGSAKQYANDAEQAAKDYADIQSAAAQAAAIATAETLVSEAVDALNESLSEVNALIDIINDENASQEAKIEALVLADEVLQEGIDEAKAYADKAQETADQALQLAQNNAASIEINAGKIADNAAAIEGNSAAIEANAAAIEANAAAIETLQGVVDALGTDVTTLQGQVSTLQTDVATALSEAAANAADITALTTQLQALSEANDQAHQAIEEEISKTNADLSALKQEVADNNDAIVKALNEAVADLETEIGTLDTKLTQAIADAVSSIETKMAQDIATAVATAQAYTDTQIAEAKAYADAAAIAAATQLYDYLVENDLADIQGQIDALGTQITTLDAKIDAVEVAYKAADEALKDDLTAYADAIQSYLEGLITTLEGRVATNEGNIGDLQGRVSTNEGNIGDLQGRVSTNEGNISDLQGRVSTNESNISDLQGRVSANEASIADIYSQIEGINEAIDAITSRVDDLEAAVKDLQTRMSAAEEAIEDLNDAVTTINKYIGILGKRLTSLVYAPTTYVDGIEAITFTTMYYTAWTDPEAAAAPTDGKVYSIDNTLNNLVEYLVSPTHMDPNSISSLSYIANTAKNISTRAATTQAPIAVDSWEYAANGEDAGAVKTLQVHLKKTTQDDFSELDDDNITLVALKATIADNYLIGDEESGEVAVYSDWARLYESHVTPYIHNTADVDGNKADEDQTDSHYYKYPVITANGGDAQTNAESYNTVEENWVVATFPYDNTLPVNLNELVTVCDGKGNVYDAAEYGFEFQFSIVEYWCTDGTDTANQSIFFSIKKVDATDDSDEHYIVWANASVSDAETGSRQAINKVAPVQVILYDTENKAIVDVCYFFIECFDVDAFYDMGNLLDDEQSYTDCGNEYTATITESTIQAKCGVIDNDVDMPITYEELSDNYTLLTGLWASHDDAKTVGTANEAAADPDLGTIALDASGNIVWSVTPAITQDDYDAGQKVITAYGVYQSKTRDSNIIPFEITMTIKLPSMTLVAVRNQTVWAENEDIRIMNPGLESDGTYGLNANYFTTQMIGELLSGYIINGQTPYDWAAMVDHCDSAHMVIDLDKLGELAEAINDKYGTSLTETDFDGSTEHTLYLDGVAVAKTQWDEDNHKVHIVLVETDNGSATSVPAEGAQLLVGQFIPIKFYAQECTWEQVLDNYYVYFMEPLTMEMGEDIKIILYDTAGGGDTSEASLNGTIELWEEFTAYNRLVWDNADPSQVTYTDLAGWYGVDEDGANYDIDGAKCNLNPNTGYIEILDPDDYAAWYDLSLFIDAKGDPQYHLSYDKESNQMIFENASGVSIIQDLQIIVPVTLKTKWQTFTAMKVVITIKPSWENPDKRPE